MVIKNIDTLATTPLRRMALEIVEAGYEAIQTDHVIQRTLSVEGNILKILNRTYDLQQFEHIYVIAFGKSSYLAAKTLETMLGDRITKGYAIGVTEGEHPEHITTIVGTHPSPSDINVRATHQIIELLRTATERDLVLAVISGGGSSLLAAPYQVDVETQGMISKALMKAGADIHELNIVRKHMSEVKGGRLAAITYPAKLVTLILSDVPGNDLSTIASGPTVMDTSTTDDARAIIDKYKILEMTDLETINFSETPKDPTVFQHVENILILDPTTAVTAMEQKAQELGFATRILSTTLEGEAHAVGKQLLNAVQPGEALIASGETTVTVFGSGIGGRNQEVVLGNLGNIKENQVLVAAASDGHDNSDYAGAIADHTTLAKAKEKGIDPQTYIDSSDSFHFFQALGEYLDTGILDSNIADMFLVLQE